ncbi:MAG: xanthine dehydrogenase molybdopterin binding subunit [Hyphomicrobiaceae bacterium]|nr:MAG: xanthine dehydrogenase molybdopterin binding subunit [Hyphomicrobiaceae bacterium]
MQKRRGEARIRISGGVGSSIAHDSARKHVTGAAIYVDDIPEPPGTLHVELGMSERAHARIKSVDLANVRAAPGVLLAITADDIPGRNDISPTPSHDDPLLADGRVEYLGQAVFAVVAETRRSARVARMLARIEYQDLPAVLTIEDALKHNSLLEPPYRMKIGDASKAIASAPRRLKGRIEIGGQEHFYLEGQAALALPGEDHEITIHCSSQHPSEIQHTVAKVLGLARHDVTVEVRRMGGGFGGKETQGNLPAAISALAARLTGRPVKCVYDRDDDFMLTGKRHDFRIDYRVGFDEQGLILGVEFDHAVRCGMSFDLSQPIADRAMFHADNAYYLPNATITSRRLKTHTQSNTAFRGFGGPQGMIGIERVIDHIAADLGLDPLEVRRRNLYRHKDDPARDRRTTPYHMQVEDCIAQDLIEALVRSAEYGARRAEIRAFNRQSPVLKRGIALTPVKFGISFTKTFLNQAGALVHVYSDGSIGLNHGGTEMGQGLFTKVAQVVAEEFQLDVARVKITATTTGKVPNTSATAASSGSDLNGMAAREAARKIKERIAAFLAERHGAGIESVVFRPGGIFVGKAIVPFDEAVREAHMGRVQLFDSGFYATPKIHWDREKASGRPFFYFSYGVAVTEVAIDTLTGENRILRTDILHDVGRSLNPAIDLGQIEGGYVQGAGWLTTEELVWDEKGRLLTHAPSTYKIPACSDRPIDLRLAIYDQGRNAEETIYRSKAVGEPPLMLAISVLMALSDAVASAGDYRVYPALDAPATPERVLKAVERVREGVR